MNKKAAFVRFAKSAYSNAKDAGNLFKLEPWSWKPAEQNDADAAAIRAIAAASGFKWGKSETAKKFSGLCVKSPGKEALANDADLNDKYNAVKMAVSRCRAQFIDPEERAAMTDWQAKAVSALVHLTPREMRAAVAAACKQRKAK